jgi:8-oxo-dGTP diphosphatase
MKTKTAEEILAKYDIPKSDWQFEIISKAMEEYASQQSIGKEKIVPNDTKFIGNVCLSFRHDFGLMPIEDRLKLQFEAKEWIRAINNNLPYAELSGSVKAESGEGVDMSIMDDHIDEVVESHSDQEDNEPPKHPTSYRDFTMTDKTEQDPTGDYDIHIPLQTHRGKKYRLVPIEEGQDKAIIEKQKYVVGFMFTNDCNNVILIRKKKPAWQIGKLNGVGGKIEINETPLNAMVREYKEEAGITFDKWNNFLTIEYKTCIVYFYKGFSDGCFYQSETKESEVIEKIKINHWPFDEVIPNLNWIISLALDPDIEHTDSVEYVSLHIHDKKTDNAINWYKYVRFECFDKVNDLWANLNCKLKIDPKTCGRETSCPKCSNYLGQIPDKISDEQIIIKLKIGDELDLDMGEGKIEHVSVIGIIPHPEVPNSVYYKFSNGSVCRDIRLH